MLSCAYCFASTLFFFAFVILFSYVRFLILSWCCNFIELFFFLYSVFFIFLVPSLYLLCSLEPQLFCGQTVLPRLQVRHVFQVWVQLCPRCEARVPPQAARQGPGLQCLQVVELSRVVIVPVWPLIGTARHHFGRLCRRQRRVVGYVFLFLFVAVCCCCWLLLCVVVVGCLLLFWLPFASLIKG